MNTQQRSLDTLFQEAVDKDTEFQNSLQGLSDEDKTKKLDERKATFIRERAEKGLKDEELVHNYKTRAEKAEKLLKGEDPDKKEKGEDPPKDPSLSTEDLYALMNNKVPEEDVDEVKKAAKLLGVSVKEALKDPLVKGRLETLAEERKTAAATSTDRSRQPNQNSEEKVVEKFKKGDIPAPGSDDAETLFWARRGGKRT